MTDVRATLLEVDRYRQAADFAARIKQELRKLDAWQSASLPESAYESDQAFLADTMTFYQWLQFVLLHRIREIVATRGSFPSGSMVGAYAVRALEGAWEASELIQVLSEFDQFIERKPHRTATPLEVAESYWRTRNPQLLAAHPHSPPSQDVQLAEQAFRTTSAFVECIGEPREISGGVAVCTVVEAERGTWVIVTVLCLEDDQWHVDLPLSLSWTTYMFLRERGINAPYTEVDDARGRAMQFWQHLLNHDDRRAREFAFPDSAPLLNLGQGRIDEFIWYLGHTESGDTATVRVLMNTCEECRTWETRMLRRDRVWLVDLGATLKETD